MDIHRAPGVHGNDFRRRSEAWDLIDLDNGEALSGVRARSQVGERERDGAGTVDFERQAQRAGPLSGPCTTQRAAARTGRSETMNQRILHVTLNTGRMAVQQPGAIQPETLKVLRPRVARLLNRQPGLQMQWLGLPLPFFPFELTSKADAYGPLFFVRWGGEKKGLARFAVGTNRTADASLWELIHQLGRASCRGGR